jgi:hypothetical protein
MAKQTSTRSSPTPTKRKRASEAPPPAPTDMVAARTPTHEEIAARALAIYQARDTQDGNALSDWLKAERELRA